MKYLITILLVLITFQLHAQEDTLSTPQPEEEVNTEVFDDGDEINILMDEVVKQDTTNIKLGHKKIQIIEDEDDTSIKIFKDDEEEEFDWEKDFDWDFDTDLNKGKFKGHWAGFEFGLNNYVNSDFNLSRGADEEFMDIHTGKSWNFNLNFAQYSLGFNSTRTGLVIGMGLEWSNYHFNNDNSIKKEDGIIVPDTITYSIIKNRLQTTYLTFPLLYELQLFEGNRSDRMYFAVGAIGGIKLFSHTKVKYTDNGTKKKNKEREDYYLSPVRVGLTARAGYKMVKLYFNYYMTPLFLDGRGPELYPLAAGMAITF